MREKPVILVVDDERLNRFTLERMLRGEGFVSLLAASGREAREMAGAHCPDLILLDIMMPGESGLSTLGSLKNEPSTASIPVILLSALADVETKVKGFELGAVDYVTKPFELPEVLARIRNTLKLKAAYEEIIRTQAERLAQVRDAQKAILVTPEDLPGAGFAVSYEPVLEAGGDFYDVIDVGGGYGYFVADVSGHDITASFATAGLKALLAQNAGPLFTPAETLGNLNSVLGRVLRRGQFLTACYCLLNARRTSLRVFSCGHPPPILMPADGTKPRFLEAGGDILGPFESVSFAPLTLDVSPGDRLYMYTDGLVEAPERDLTSGLPELLEACAACRTHPLRESVEAVRSVMGRGGPFHDDAVLLAVEV
ncbi:response regulator receiver modulated serine phosphatase [Desulfovibrio sp. X2]|uniref:PP2C family protein-serine/threonine phosphatase n=1 Tax=Desulfovibrio sp. X2 TaxID=941449 RepID=UPI000358EE5C|nr:fused response regulator/phosphatase [Desulfovibrio sp. X2]EPR44243.1 response regulator receiver modulated serine phosphatase [Desulfovibrio sp. X2]